MQLWTDWLSLAGICLLGAMSPGPSLAVIVRHSVRGGRREGIIAAWAHGAGIGLYALLSVLGIAALLLAAPGLLWGLQTGGALFLLYLAWQGGRSALSGAPVADKPGIGSRQAGRDGFLMAFLNPKTGLFFIALFSQFVVPGQALPSKLGMAALAMGIDTLWYLLVALLLGSGIARAGFLRWQRPLEGLFALLLAGLALRMLWLLSGID
ncbi:MAG: LysE family translocator [Chromatiales bacterium]|nr:LysE family translocator [Gammaproteobacteria bacterium]MBW6475527.1 LysE family translocator [Chromatiales bacterium]